MGHNIYYILMFSIQKGERMKRFWLLFLLIFGLCGAVFFKVGFESAIKEDLQKKTLKNSGIEKDKNYIDYQNKKSNGEVGENGLANNELIKNVNPEELQFEYVVTSGSVKANLTSTNIVEVNYYLNKEMTQRLRSICDIEPKTTIYASVSELKKSYSETHEFIGLELKTDGKKYEMVSYSEDGALISFSVPANINSLVVTPKTELKKINIDFDDFFVDENSTKQKLFGAWEVNGVKYSRDNPLKESKSGKYTFNYYYDQNEYYINPLLNGSVYNSENGKVVFTSKNIYSDETEVLQLSKYITIKLNNEYQKGISQVQVNGLETDFSNGQLLKIKCGDRVQITTNKDYTITIVKIPIESAEPLSDGRTKYTFIIPSDTYILSYEVGVSKGKDTTDFVQKNIENGRIEVRYAESNDNAEVGLEQISDKEKVIVTIIPDFGYYITGKDTKYGIYEKTMEYKKYKENIDEIIAGHQIKKYITLTLSLIDSYGTVSYKIDGKEVFGVISNLMEGQIIELIYEVTDDAYQINKDNIFSNTKKKTVKIEVTNNLNGSIINRSQYIEVSEKGA